jgi:hypothetical protein
MFKVNLVCMELIGRIEGKRRPRRGGWEKRERLGDSKETKI